LIELLNRIDHLKAKSVPKKMCNNDKELKTKRITHPYFVASNSGELGGEISRPVGRPYMSLAGTLERGIL
jgi:hypothetical protein